MKQVSANEENMETRENEIADAQAEVTAVILQLSVLIDAVPTMFRQFSREELLNKTAGKWCRQEILGHLIDSAINNLKRFTDIQCLPQPYTLQTYRQDELVIVNDYINLPLEHLLQLWSALNQQVVFAAENIPSEILLRQVHLPGDKQEIKTLGWLTADYVEHLQHHLRQLK